MRGASSETRILQQKLSNITSHPFVNFFLELCKSRDGLDLDDLAKKAGKLWREMDVSEKVPYYRLARKVKKIAKSKKGLDDQRSKRRQLRPRQQVMINQPKNRRMLSKRRKSINPEAREDDADPSKENHESSDGDQSSECNSVERYCLDVLKRRYSRSSSYESD